LVRRWKAKGPATISWRALLSFSLRQARETASAGSRRWSRDRPGTSRDCPGAGQDAFVHAIGEGRCSREQLPALFRQLDCVGACIFPRAPAMQEPLALQATDDVGERRTVDAGQLYETGLAEPLVTGHHHQHGDLTGRDVTPLHFRLENLVSALSCPMQEMGWRALQLPRIFLCHPISCSRN